MYLTIKSIIFTVITMAILFVSRGSLRSYRLHGFYRFFAWELIAILVILQLDRWFVNPFAWYQIISWTLLILSIFLVVEGFRLLRVIGRPDKNRSDEGLIGLEKTTRLIAVGAYRFIRHPLYSSLLCLAWGAFFKSPAWVVFILAIAASVFLALTAKAEEIENLRFFGEEYQIYMGKTKMFIPFVF